MKLKRIGAIDGLKGITTVLLVVLASLPGDMTKSSLVGYSFVVVVGYLLALHIEQEQQQYTPGQLLQKLAKRLWLPLIWVILVTVCVLYMTNLELLKNQALMAVKSLALVSNTEMVAYISRATLPGMDGGLSFTWFISLVAQCLVVFGTLIALAQRFQLRNSLKAIGLLVIQIACQIIMAGIIIAEGQTGLLYNLSYVSAFLSGSLIAYVTPVVLNLIYKLEHKRLLLTIVGLLSAAAWLLVAMTFIIQDSASLFLGVTLMVLLTSVIVFTIISGVPIVRFMFELPLFRLIGQRSYAYYLAMGVSYFLPAVIYPYRLVFVIVVSEILYQLFKLNRPYLRFINGSWVDDVTEMLAFGQGGRFGVQDIITSVISMLVVIIALIALVMSFIGV